MPLSNYARNKFLDHLHGKTSFTMPTAYAALASAGTASSVTEVAYTSYARVSTAGADWNAASAGSSTNANAITFPTCTGSTGTGRYIAFFDALTTGNLLSYAPIVGSNTYKPIVSITRVSSTATVTCTAHGYSNSDEVDISGMVQTEYNGNFTISNVTTNTFDITVTGTPTTPGTFDIASPRVVKLSILSISNNIQPQVAASAYTDQMR